MKPTRPESQDSKICLTCGRTITWRKKWKNNWAAVRYCSERCRRSKPSALDGKAEQTILELLGTRARGASICPSEAAQRLAESDTDWRTLMEPVRRAARRLWAQGLVEITQQGRVVDPSRAKGPIRIRKSMSGA